MLADETSISLTEKRATDLPELPGAFIEASLTQKMPGTVASSAVPLTVQTVTATFNAARGFTSKSVTVTYNAKRAERRAHNLASNRRLRAQVDTTGD